MKRSITAASLCACLLTAGVRADQPDGWGHAGSVLMQGGISVQNTSYDSSGSSSSSLLQVTLTPGFQVFVAGPLVLGAALQLVILSSSGSTWTTIGLQPSIGVNVDLGPVAALLPQVNFTYASVSREGASQGRVAVGGYLPVIFHPVPHFFLGFGPDFSIDLTTTASNNGSPPKTTTFGLQTVLGGYF